MTTVLEKLNEALFAAMEADSRVYLIGEDILDPYGGAFKVSRGLSTHFPEQVLTTPISEGAIVGLCNGMALRGLRPVAEIMFGDFVTLATDQLVNHAAKFRWMYNDNIRVPLVVRTPMGGRRGYGPTHSQSLEKLFLGIAGLKVVAPNTLGDPGELLKAAIADEDPVLFIEHKLLYTRSFLEQSDPSLIDWRVEVEGSPFPTFVLRPEYPPTVTIATYGYNFELVREAAVTLLMEYEIFCEVVLFSQLSPFDIGRLIDSLRVTRRLVTFEEATISLGWGAEILARAAESGIEDLKVRRCAALDLPIGNAKSLEDSILPSSHDIVQTVLELVSRDYEKG